MPVGTERWRPEHLAASSGTAELLATAELSRPHLLPLSHPTLRYRLGPTPLEFTLSRLLQHLLPFGGTRGLPALAQRLPTLRRQALKLAEIIAHRALPIGWQRAELFPALPQLLPLRRWQRLPALESLPSRAALLRRHVDPSVAAVREGLLALRRQRLPVAREARQEPLLIGRERAPRNPLSARSRRRRGRLRLGEHHPARRDERQESCDAHRINAPRPHCF